MALRCQGSLARACASACAAGVFVTCLPPSRAEETGSTRPGLPAACEAWHAHIGDLIEQHRLSNEIDEARLGEIIRLFDNAQFACTMGRFAEGIAIYDSIPIGRPSRQPLR